MFFGMVGGPPISHRMHPASGPGRCSPPECCHPAFQEKVYNSLGSWSLCQLNLSMKVPRPHCAACSKDWHQGVAITRRARRCQSCVKPWATWSPRRQAGENVGGKRWAAMSVGSPCPCPSCESPAQESSFSRGSRKNLLLFGSVERSVMS